MADKEKNMPMQEPENQDPVKLELLKLNVPVVNNWVWDARPEIIIEAENVNAVAQEAAVKVTISTDKGETVEVIEFTEEIPANGKKDITVTTSKDLAPGFYKAKCTVNKKTPSNFTFGISPYDLVSAPDMQSDFDEYWANAKLSLPEIVEGETVTLTEVPSQSSATRKVYLVRMQSAPNSPDGEPVIVRGFYKQWQLRLPCQKSSKYQNNILAHQHRKPYYQSFEQPLLLKQHRKFRVHQISQVFFLLKLMNVFHPVIGMFVRLTSRKSRTNVYIPSKI